MTLEGLKKPRTPMSRSSKPCSVPNIRKLAPSRPGPKTYMWLETLPVILGLEISTFSFDGFLNRAEVCSEMNWNNRTLSSHKPPVALDNRGTGCESLSAPFKTQQGNDPVSDVSGNCFLFLAKQPVPIRKNLLTEYPGRFLSPFLGPLAVGKNSKGFRLLPSRETDWAVCFVPGQGSSQDTIRTWHKESHGCTLNGRF